LFGELLSLSVFYMELLFKFIWGGPSTIIVDSIDPLISTLSRGPGLSKLESNDAVPTLSPGDSL
jgi:hypothetical protein